MLHSFCYVECKWLSVSFVFLQVFLSMPPLRGWTWVRLRQLRTFEDLGWVSSTQCPLPFPPDYFPSEQLPLTTTHTITTLLFFFFVCPPPPQTAPLYMSNSKQWIDPGSLLTPVSCPTTMVFLQRGKKEIKKSTQTSLHQLEQLMLDCMSAFGEDPCLINRGLIQDRNSPQHVNPSGPCNHFFFMWKWGSCI